MRQLIRSVRKEQVTRGKFITCSRLLIRASSFQLQLGEPLDGNRDLKQEHTTSDVLADVESACDS